MPTPTPEPTRAEPTRTERVASVRAEQIRRDRFRRVALSAGIVALLAVVVAAGVWFSGGGSDTTAAPGGTPKAAVSGQALVVGDSANAPVKVVVYEDFLCPYCRQFETSSRAFLHSGAAAGKVQVTYRPFQLLGDPYSKLALNAWSAVLEKGTPAQALRFHDLLYDNQPYESAATKPDAAALKALAKQAGVSDPTILAAFDTENTTFYAKAEQAAQQAKVSGTPTVVVNGKELTGATIDSMVGSLETQIARS